MKLEKLPVKVGSRIVLVKFLSEEENYSFVERNFQAKDQFQYSEAVTAEVLTIGPNCEDFNIEKGDVLLLYTKSLLKPRFIEYNKELYYLVNMDNTYIASFGKK